MPGEILFTRDGAIATAFAFLDTHDYAEGIAAFLDKRAPKFEGR